MKINNSKKNVIVALSGGVDSAVAAALLLDQGYSVEGIFMKNWSGDQYSLQEDCPWEVDQKDAENVCKQLGIPFRSVNFEKEYRAKVVEYFFSEYKAGRTPNPDIVCNKEIKFNVFLQKAVSLGADYIATGHYARILKSSDGPVLAKGVDKKKDQSYFLHTLSKKQLSRVLFPLGDLEKSEVRKLAKKYKLPVATKKDSQGICFIGKIDVSEFLRKRIDQSPGEIIDIESKEVVGKHDGISFYTIGQRQGLGIGGVKKPYYVVEKDIENNIIYVANGEDNPYLYHRSVSFSSPTFDKLDIKSEKVSASVRYRHDPEVGKLNFDDMKFIFDKPQRAISPGQSIVFYQGDICIGGAIIEHSS